MTQRRRVTVSGHERKRWLEQLEEGTGITQIARDAGRDIRVVKRHIEIARGERESSRARGDFIRDRLERHQDDLLEEVRRMRDVLLRLRIESLEPTDGFRQKIYGAFQTHVARGRTATQLARWEPAVHTYLDTREALLKQLAERESQLMVGLPRESLWEWHASVFADADLAGGQPGCFAYEAKASEDGNGIHIVWGGHSLTRKPVDPAARASIVEAHKDLRRAARGLIDDLQPHHDEISRLSADLADELDVFLLRRLVPGTCRYCPA